MARFDRILVAVDFSELSAEALKCAIDLATRLESELEVIHVLQVQAAELREGAMADADEVQQRAVAELESELAHFVNQHLGNGIEIAHGICAGEPAAEINKAAREREAGLIVMGTHGRTGLAHLLMGSVAEHVLRTAEVPVLVVRG